MRNVLYAAATLAVAAALSPSVLAGVLAAAASVLFESVPFLLAATLLQWLLRDDRLIAYAGCGCVRGPSARSIPAAVATAMLFGVWAALARLLAATISAATIARRHTRHACGPLQGVLLDDLRALLFAALIAGCASQVTGYVDLRTLPPGLAVVLGIALGFIAAPCALGAVAIAAALHARSPAAATAFLCVAGVADLRALSGRREVRTCADASAYILLTIALAVVGARHGDALVRPAIAPLLTVGAAIAMTCAVRYRGERNAKARWAPGIMLAGALATAPPPTYTATETTLNDIFPGERLDFTGRLARHGDSAAVVRYAITCCRADAAPVVIRLCDVPRLPSDTWVRASGSVENVVSEFRLRIARIERVPPPSDPFIYR